LTEPSKPLNRNSPVNQNKLSHTNLTFRRNNFDGIFKRCGLKRYLWTTTILLIIQCTIYTNLRAGVVLNPISPNIFCCNTSVLVSAEITAGGLGRTNSPPLIFQMELSNVGGVFAALPIVLGTFSTPDEHWYEPADHGILTGTISCPIANGSYNVRVRVFKGGSVKAISNIQPIVIGSTSVIANAGSSQTICGIIPVTLSANNASPNTGSWSVLSGPNTSSSQFSSLTNPSAQFAPIGGNGPYNLNWSISNGLCISNSSISITFNPVPIITTQPKDILDCEGLIVSFNVVASGTGLTYLWQRKKPLGSFSDIPVELNVSYPTLGAIRIQNVGNSDAPDGTQYRVIITNSNNCSITSNAVILNVNEITSINPTTTHVTLCQGANYSYTVTTSYPSNVVSYQWKRWSNPGQWDPVVNEGAISGATTNQLIFTGATPSESGQYKVTVVFHSTGADCNVTSDSRNRVLTVNPKPTCYITGSDGPLATSSTGNIYFAPAGMSAYAWSIAGNYASISGVTSSTVTISTGTTNNAPFTLNLTITDANGCSSTCSKTVTVNDKQPPTFIPPGPLSFCVENIFSAEYLTTGIKINPDPDYYLFKHGDTSLDLNPATFNDNCCALPNDQFTIRWEIVFSSGETTITGVGQPSTYVINGIPADFKLWGDGLTFATRIHKIRYWLKDCNGNETIVPVEQTITIKPRPKFI